MNAKIEQDLEKLDTDLCKREINDSSLGSYLKMSQEFNVFRVLKLDQYEIRHSNMLGWLLDPSENHGLGEKFLSRFFDSIECLRALSLKGDQLRGFSVLREADHKDIEIRSDEAKIVIVIENKWNAIERESTEDREGQLRTYHQVIENNDQYRNWTKLYLFLTPTGMLPSKVNQDIWLPVSYSVVIKVIESVLKEQENKDDPSGPMMLISNYLSVLKTRSDIMSKDERLVSECKAIYNKHREAIRLITDVLKENRKVSGKEKAFEIANEVLAEKIERDDHVLKCPKPNIGQPSFFTSLMNSVIPPNEGTNGSWHDRGDKSTNYYYWFDADFPKDDVDKIRLHLKLEFGGLGVGESSTVLSRMNDIETRANSPHKGKSYPRFHKVWDYNKRFSMSSANYETDVREWVKEAIEEALKTEKEWIDAFINQNVPHWQEVRSTT